MNSAHVAALRDYPRRVRFPVVMVFSVLFLLPVIKGYVEKTDWAGEYTFLIGCLILVTWTGLISGHLKQVLARPQACLLPGFARAQVQIAALLIAPALLIAAGGAFLVGFRPVGAVAMACFIASLYWTWPYLFDRGGLLMLFGPSVVWWLTVLSQEPRVQDWPGWINLGLEEDIWYILLLIISIALISFVTRRMLRLTESSFEYRSDPSIGWRRGSSPDSDTPFISIFKRLLPWLGRYRIRARTSLFHANSWERINHWRRGMGPRSPVVSGLSMAVMVALVGSYFLFYDKESSHVSTAVLAAYLFMFPFNRYSYTHRRRVHFGSESLFPGSRAAYVRELGIATAIDILLSWFFLCLGVIIARALGLFGSMPWTWVPFILAMSLGTTLFGIGMSPWILQLNGDKIPSFVLTMMVFMVGMGLTLALYKTVGVRMPLAWLLPLPLLAGLGALSAWHGYRRWCTNELGRNDL